MPPRPADDPAPPAQDARAAGGVRVEREDFRPARPMRADARRNYERLLGEAQTVFNEQGADAPLEEIARRSGVGIGTLYRHFPSRLALQEAVYCEDVEELCSHAEVLAEELTPPEALRAWLREFVDHMGRKRGLAKTLMETYAKDSAFFRSCHNGILVAGEMLLTRAQESGDIRRDVKLREVLRLVNGVALANEQIPGDADRMICLVMDSLRYQPR